MSFFDSEGSVALKVEYSEEIDMVAFSLKVFAVLALASFGAVAGTSSTDCPTPTTPENGEYLFYQGRMTVKYSCTPGHRLVGKVFSVCQNGEWSSPAPQCEPINATDGDPVASYDYTCYQADVTGYATLIRAPRIPNARSPIYHSSKNPREPYNAYLYAVYQCKPGYRMRNLIHNTLYCSQRSWLGERPVCDSMDCSVNNGGCEQVCVSYPNGAYMMCRCNSGFRLAADQRSCVRAISSRSCSVNNGNCEQRCFSNSAGTFLRCGCNTGYSLATDGMSCVRGSTYRRSCSMYNGYCSQICTPDDINESVICSCNSGFFLATDGRTCYDINECAKDNFGCSHNCMNIRGSARCSCPRGYTLATDGKTCQGKPTATTPRRSCSYKNGFCYQICNDSSGDVQCSCRDGFQLGPDRRMCIDINECSEDNFGCSQTCVNTQGSAHCKCIRGYILSSDGKTCEDIDECANERMNRCHHKCTNTVGSYTCSCLPGYVMLQNNTCVGCPKDSYMTEYGSCEDCPANSHTIGEGKSTLEDCICDSGYTGNPGKGIPCTDIDECEEDNFGCSHECINTPGSAHCFCSVGYELKSDHKTCVDIDECSIKNGGCEITCHNTIGSFYCSCPEGYRSSRVDAYSCIDIDECAEKNHTCSHICNNFPGGYYCSCGDGQRLDSSQKTCAPVTCSQIAVPHHAKLLCGTSKGKRSKVDPATAEFSYGTTCTFKCNQGYKLDISPGTITCGEDGSWEGEKPKCVPLTCEPIEAPPNGNVVPASCATRGGEVQQKCYVTCNNGFELRGNPVFTCKRDLTWRPEVFPFCKPVKVLPHVACLPDITVELLPGKNSTEIDILPPMTNMDPEYISTSPEWVKIGNVAFPAGTTDITYTVTSPTVPNVTSTCTRTVNIIDKEPPRVTDCPEFISVESSADSDNLITWNEPKFEDNVGVVAVAKTMEPNISLGPGVHFVEYTARDAEGNVAECVFHINVTEAGCKDPIGPENGHPNCDDWIFGKICEPTCDRGYTFYSTEPSFYTCDSSGAWSPSNVIESCIKYIAAVNYECPDGMELRFHDETAEEICVECPSNMLWSNNTKTCLDTDT